MDIFSTSDLRRLNATSQGPCISMFLPTHAAGRDGQQDALRLKNLAAAAERELVRMGVRSSEARDLLDPVRDLPNEASFWEKRSHGLAVFLSPDVFDRFRVPLELEESLAVNQRFQIKPLLPLLSSGDRFFVLALSQNRVRLLEGRRYSIHDVSVDGLPENLDQVLNLDTVERASQVHSAMRGDHGKQAAVFHGHGGEREVVKDELTQFFRVVDTALRDALRQQKAPMFLAGVQYLLPIFREVASYASIADEELPGNPDHLSAHELHDRVWPLMERHVRAAHDMTGDKYRQLAGTGKTSDDVRQIVPAAHQGQVESLFVDCRAHRWGVFDADSGDVQLHDPRQAGDDDLLDLAAVQTLLNRGNVFAVDADELPAEPVAAVFRY